MSLRSRLRRIGRRIPDQPPAAWPTAAPLVDAYHPTLIGGAGNGRATDVARVAVLEVPDPGFRETPSQLCHDTNIRAPAVVVDAPTRPRCAGGDAMVAPINPDRSRDTCATCRARPSRSYP